MLQVDSVIFCYNRFLRYPFIASEIFYAEIDGIVNAFFNEKPSQSVIHDTTEEHGYNENSSAEKNNNEESPDNSNENSGEDIPNPYEKDTKEENEEEEEKKQNEIDLKEEFQYELLFYLFKFLEGDKKLNVTSVGYFSKAVNALLNKRFIEVFSNFDFLIFFEKDGCFYSFE